MEIEELEARINTANDEMVSADEVVEIDPQPTDVWQKRINDQANMRDIVIHGSRPKAKLDLDLLLEGSIQDAYKKALDDSESLRAQGDTARARLVEQQYMQDYYYPVIDALIRLNSQQEILANQDALELLDALAIVPGGGATDGYASVFISQLYEPDTRIQHSDAQVREAVNKVKWLCNNGQIRQAIGLAERMQNQIDRGDNLATNEDYLLFQKVALRR